MYSEIAAEYQDSVIENDGFFPDIDCGDFEKTRDIPPRISHATVRNALLSSVVMINARLENYQRRCFAQGFASMADLPGVKIRQPAPPVVSASETAETAAEETENDTENRAETEQEIAAPAAPAAPVRQLNASEALYIRAVYAMAKADLMAEGAANGIKDNRPGTDGDELRRSLLTESAQAVRALVGVGRSSVTLID